MRIVVALKPLHSASVLQWKCFIINKCESIADTRKYSIQFDKERIEFRVASQHVSKRAICVR